MTKDATTTSTTTTAATRTPEDHDDDDVENENNKIKDTAFGICFLRTLLSLLPEEAGSLRYDPQTPQYEGVALEFRRLDTSTEKVVEEEEPWHSSTLKKAQKHAAAFGVFMESTQTFDKWNGLSFAICRTHYVDRLLLDSVLDDDSPIQQIVICGVGQDYRAMRHGQEIQNHHDTKVFELDLPVMMEMRRSVKKRIQEEAEKRNSNGKRLILPETYSLSIDFGKQHVSQVLLDCPAFDTSVPTLYLWEGVSYYLTPKAMRSFFQDIVELMNRTPPKQRQHHRLFFDHLIDLPRIVDTEEDAAARAMLDMFQDSEPLRSFLDYDQVDPFLRSLGLCVLQHVQPREMYRPYQLAKDKQYHLNKESKYFGLVVAKPTM